MKVIQINAVYEYSSTGRTTTEMHEYFLQHGIESYVFCTNKEEKGKNIFKFSGICDKKLHSVLSRIFGYQGMYSYFSTKTLIGKLEEIQPDIVHLRVLHSNCINLPLLLRYLGDNNISTVITLHDCWYFTGHCCYFIDSKCDRWKDKCGHCPDFRKWNPSLFFDDSFNLLRLKKDLFGKIKHLAVIGVSDWVTNFIKDSILKNAYIVKRIYNWIDFSKFTLRDSDVIRKSIGISKDDFVVLGVAQRWTPTKGLDDFIKLANMCSEFKFVIVGEVYNNKLPDNVVSVGVVSDETRLIDMYSMADVFFNPSLRETFGKVTIESMAAGTPVVAYNATATPELIHDGCGYVVEAGDIHSAYECVQKIYKVGKKLYSESCRLFAKSEFDKTKLITDYIDLYHSLLKR